MSWDWVPPRPGEEDGSDGGPSPALRRTVTVLAVLLTAAEAVTSSPARFRMGLRLSALTRARTAYVSCMPTTHGC